MPSAEQAADSLFIDASRARNPPPGNHDVNYVNSYAIMCACSVIFLRKHNWRICGVANFANWHTRGSFRYSCGFFVDSDQRPIYQANFFLGMQSGWLLLFKSQPEESSRQMSWSHQPNLSATSNREGGYLFRCAGYDICINYTGFRCFDTLAEGHNSQVLVSLSHEYYRQARMCVLNSDRQMYNTFQHSFHCTCVLLMCNFWKRLFGMSLNVFPDINNFAWTAPGHDITNSSHVGLWTGEIQQNFRVDVWWDSTTQWFRFCCHRDVGWRQGSFCPKWNIQVGKRK